MITMSADYVSTGSSPAGRTPTSSVLTPEGQRVADLRIPSLETACSRPLLDGRHAVGIHLLRHVLAMIDRKSGAMRPEQALRACCASSLNVLTGPARVESVGGSVGAGDLTHQIAGHLTYVPAAKQRHVPADPGVEEGEHPVNAGFASRGQSV